MSQNQTKPRRGVLKRVLRIVGFCILAAVIILYLLLPAGFGAFASARHPSNVGNPPDGFEKVALTASDGVKLAAWYVPSKNGTAVVLVHGATTSREAVRPYARMLADHGFGVLAFDMRGHGESGGGGNAFGWEAVRDVGAAVAYLLKQDNVRAIGGLGTSLGGEVLLGSVSSYPGLKAVVSDGATHRSIDDYIALPSRRDLVHSWTTRVMYAAAGLFSGDVPPVTMVESITQAQDARFLFIAAGSEKDEIEYNTHFQETVGERAELWVVPGVGHISAFAGYPKEYEERVIAFLESALNGDRKQ